MRDLVNFAQISFKTIEDFTKPIYTFSLGGAGGCDSIACDLVIHREKMEK
jgi:hypothetical protein